MRDGVPARGMPGVALAGPELRQLLAFLKTMRAPDTEAAPRLRVETLDGVTLDGVALNQSTSDLQLLGDDGRLHLLRPSGSHYRRVTSDVDWPGYHGAPTGNRFSRLGQIGRDNVARLAPAWMFAVSGAERLQVTPVVVGGVMYVTNVNECYALDAGSGRRIWHFRRPRTKGLAGDAAAGINRGVAVSGDRVFMVTDDARLVALNRFTGALLWDTEMADWRQNYGATSAPLAVGELVVSGISGGDEGVRGFLAAFDQATGRQVWRFWTVPRPGEPGAETWRGKDIEHGCASTWLTGTYDADLDTLYWPTGNPCPDYDGRERWATTCTRTRSWPWILQRPPEVALPVHAARRVGLGRAAAAGAGRRPVAWPAAPTAASREPQRLLLRAGSNHRRVAAGNALCEKADLGHGHRSGDGRPLLVPGQAPTPDGVTVCPAVEGATNWFSTAFSPDTGLYYVQALEKCTVYTLSPSTMAGRQLVLQRDDAQRRGGSGAEDPARDRRGDRRGALGGAAGWRGDVLGRHAGNRRRPGLLRRRQRRAGRRGRRDGRRLWQFQTSAMWKASPMTYAFDGRQHIAVAAGSTIVSFALIQ